ncbi:MAG TPA: ATP-binding protein [Bellilinea sp.]|nr:ATP-binding protein [Bellilinea sp.]
MTKESSPILPLPGLRWRGFTLQFFLIAILPLAILMLAVVFISQSLHHEAMVQLVGDRNLRAVRAVADALSMQLDHKVSSLRTVGQLIESGVPLDGTNPAMDLIHAEFSGGLGLYDAQNALIVARSGGEFLADLPERQAEFWAQVKASQPSGAVLMADTQPDGILELVGLKLSDGTVLVGGFSPAPGIQQAVASILTTEQARLLVVNQANAVLYYSGEAETLGVVNEYPGVTEALNGESGVNSVPSHHGDLVTAFSYIPQAGWALVLEENWEEIATPFLSTTQSAPLILVPLLVLALVALLFGARQIVQPLQKLEVKAASLARGDFEGLREPVGGIAEIRNLQNALSGTAEDLESAQDALRSYIGAITDGVEKERRGLARELHDDTLQALIALNQRLQLARDSADTPEERASIDQLGQMTEQTITNLRRMVRGLRPIYLEDLGLTAALEMLAKETSATGGLEVAYSTSGEPQRLAPEVELALYRMAQEALTNARKHADAQRVQLTVNFTPESVGFSVQDDGVGFVVPETPDEFAHQGHFGLLGLAERAELIGAILRVESQPGQGTRVQVTLPQ